MRNPDEFGRGFVYGWFTLAVIVLFCEWTLK
jgi:hypothetical protein